MTELQELDVLIVDCQTTGASPALGAVLELGWCVTRPSREQVEALQAHWVALPQGHAVSSQVRRLTGFDERCALGALPPAEIWQRLRASTGVTSPVPAAIHFARFEVSFLRDWAERFEPGTPFPLDPVCLHAIACRLYPDLPRRSLRALAGYLGHGLHLERRSLGHVEASAFIWRKLSAELAARGVRDWEELRSFLASPRAAAPRGGRRVYPLPSTRYRALPDAPGVYRFLRSNGDVLYVGKAASLRKRVASHFKGRGANEPALEMLTQTSDVQVTLTATPLEAALLENESIKALCPPYNVQLTGSDRPAWFASERFDAAAPCRDEIHRIGPLPSRFSLAPLGALLALASGAAATPSLRARALGAAEAWVPDERVFSEAFADFRRRHLAELGAGESERRVVLRAARKLALLARSIPVTEPAELALPEVEESDPERVARHLERSVAQAYQLLRRAPWLRLLHDGAVAYREPESERTRLLVLREGTIVEASDVASLDAASRAECPAPRRGGQLPFDRAKYDRLRILSSELKRIRRDEGSAAVCVGRGRRLAGDTLDGILRWV